MDWIEALTIILSIFALFLVAVPFLISRMDSLQKENNAKFEQLLNRIDSNQKESNIRFEAINGKFEAMNGRFNGIENRLTSMESEIKNVNQNLGQRIESTNQRIDNTNQRITDLKTDMNQRLSTIEGYLVPKKVFHFEESDHKDEPKEN